MTISPYTTLKNEILRLGREKHHLEYLSTCKEIGIIPKFLWSKSKFISENFSRYKFEFQMKCLASLIRTKHALIDRISRKIYGSKNDGLYDKFARYATGGVFDHSMRVIEIYRHRQEVDLQKKLWKKIEHLSGNLKSFKPQTSKSNYLNLSSYNFTPREENLLNKGPKYILGKNIKPIDFVPQLEDIVKCAPPDKKEELRCLLFISYMKHLKTSHKTHRHENKLVNSLRNISDIAIIKTDKSNKVAILDRQDYISKMNTTINNIDCEPVNQDPLPSSNYKVNKIAKAFKSSCWPEDVRKLAKLNPLGVIPHLIGVLKDHKPLLPIRPIVRKCMAPSFFIEKLLVIILKELLPPSTFVINSTSQFITKLEELVLPNDFIIFTMDIVALYPSINMEKARDNILQILNTNTNFTDSMTTTIVSAINFLIFNNFFIFNKQIYRQRSGAPMGSPVSGLMAEFILRPLEELFFSSISLKPLCWLRYVDDIFGVWPHSLADFEKFFKTLNEQDASIQFTKQLETDNSIAYLDVLLRKDAATIDRSVYRKHCNNLSTIPKQAAAPLVHKQAAFRSYIKRAMTVCTLNTIHEELNNIRKIAINNGYSITFINNLISKCNNPQQHPSTVNTKLPSPKRVSIEYIPSLHEKLKRILRPYNIQLVARTSGKLKEVLRTDFDTIPVMHTPGVYEVPLLHLNNTISYYIGQTARKLYHRINEHKADFKKAAKTSAIYKAYADDPTIMVLFDQAKIIAPYTNNTRTILRESLEIYRRGSEACNEQDSYKIPSIWLSII